MVKAILSRSSLHLSGLILGKILSFALFILLARVLLPAKFGELVLFFTIFQLITALANFGLKPWFQTQVHLLGVKTAFNNAVSARVLTLIVSILTLTVLLCIYQPFVASVSFFLILISIPEAMLSIAEGYWIQQKEPLKVGFKNPIYFLLLAGGWFLTGMSTSLSEITGIQLLGSAVTAIWFFPWSQFKFSQLNFFQFKNLSTLRQSSAYALLTTTSLVYSRADQLIIQSFRGFTALGIYSAAYRLLDSINLLPQVVAENLFPEAAQPGKVSLKQLGKIELVVSALGAMAAITLWLLSPIIVPLLLGAEYLAAIPILSILSLVLFLFFVNAPLASVVQSSSLVKRFLPWGIGNTLLNVILNLFWVPIVGIVASAWIMVLTEAFGLFINLFFLKKVYAK